MDLLSEHRVFLQKLVDEGGSWKVAGRLEDTQIRAAKDLEAEGYLEALECKIGNVRNGRSISPTLHITTKGREKLQSWNSEVEKQNRDRLEQSLPHRAKRWGWEALRWGITVISAVFLTQWAQELWDESSNSDADPVGFELRAPELVWDRDCWAVAGDVVAIGKTAPVMHVTLSYDWKGRKNGQEGWIGVTVRDGVGKLKARLPHHTDKEAAPRLQFALHSWQPAYGGAFEVIGGE